MFQRHAVRTQKSRPSPRDHTSLPRGTLGNGFWRPSSQSTFLLLTLSNPRDCQHIQKNQTHSLALICPLSHHSSSFLSYGKESMPFWKTGSINGLKTDKACTAWTALFPEGQKTTPNRPATPLAGCMLTGFYWSPLREGTLSSLLSCFTITYSAHRNLMGFRSLAQWHYPSSHHSGVRGCHTLSNNPGLEKQITF